MSYVRSIYLLCLQGFIHKFLDEQGKLESDEREKDRKLFLQLSTILENK